MTNIFNNPIKKLTNNVSKSTNNSSKNVSNNVSNNVSKSDSNQGTWYFHPKDNSSAIVNLKKHTRSDESSELQTSDQIKSIKSSTYV